MAVNNLGPLDWRIPIVTPEGRPTQEFQRRWATQIDNNEQIGGSGITLGMGPPTIPDPSDGAQYVDISTNPYLMYIASGGVWNTVGAVEFTQLGDVPSSYSGSANNIVVVNPTATGLQFRKLQAADIPLLTVGFILNSGATGTNVGPELIAPRAGSLTTCKVATKSSHPSTPLTFVIKKNGSTVLTATVPAGTSPGTVSTFSFSTTVAAHDVFTIDVTSGNFIWAATIQLEQ